MRPPSFANLISTIPWILILGAIGLFSWFSSAAGQATLDAIRPSAVWMGRKVGLTTGPVAWTPNVREPPPAALQTFWDLEVPLHAPYRISSGYGWRVHPVYGSRKFHNGIDMAVPVGTLIYAPQSGKVTKVAENRRSGKFMTVDHGQGVQTTYCHLDVTEVPRGEHVAHGQIIARSGNTGASTGPHLHWIIKVDGQSIDPAVLLEAIAQGESAD